MNLRSLCLTKCDPGSNRTTSDPFPLHYRPYSNRRKVYNLAGASAEYLPRLHISEWHEIW